MDIPSCDILSLQMKKEEKKIREYFSEKESIQNALLDYLNTENTNEDFFLEKISYLKDRTNNKQAIQKNRQELKNFLFLLLNISNNHHRTPNFFSKVNNILIYLSEIIKLTFSNYDLFQIFQSNKSILLFLISQRIILLDENILKEIFEEGPQETPKYCHFFVPEIKRNLNDTEKVTRIEEEILKVNEHNFEDYEQKRLIGENDSYISSLIRSDSINDFIEYISQFNISISSEINQSIFETNQFLIDKKPTLIEYAGFFGSIQIFKYLLVNKATLTPSLWLYAIHSNNPELIHLLEENNIKPDDATFEECFEESIKCHHNELANYFENNYLNYNSEKENYNEKAISCIFKYSNYTFFPDNFIENFVFFYLCKYDYSEIVKHLLKSIENEIKYIDEIPTILFF